MLAFDPASKLHKREELEMLACCFLQLGDQKRKRAQIKSIIQVSSWDPGEEADSGEEGSDLEKAQDVPLVPPLIKERKKIQFQLADGDLNIGQV